MILHTMALCTSADHHSMDAISFVLGIKSSHLRSAHLRDLVYRGRVLRTSKINGDGSATTNGVNGHANGDVASDDEGTLNGTQERNDPKSYGSVQSPIKAPVNTVSMNAW